MMGSQDDGNGWLVCQDCGGEVLMEVSWDNVGVDKMYIECKSCGRAGWIDAAISLRTDDDRKNAITQS